MTQPWLRVAFAAYLALLLALTLLPVPGVEPDPGRPFAYLRPFETIGRALADGFDLAAQRDRLLVGNVAAFVPLGVFVPLLRRWSRAWLVVFVGGLLLSIAIELAQLGLSLTVGHAYRQADVDDVLLNTVGALGGYALIVGCRSAASARTDRC